jgi:hypothetical protein
MYNLLKKRNLLIPVICSLIMSACTKDAVTNPDPGTQPPASGKKLSKIEYDGGSYEAIEYNVNGTISKITNHIAYTNGTPAHVVYSFVYVSGVLSEVRGDDGSKYKYSFVNQQPVRTEVYAATGNMIAFYEYTYTGSKLARTDGYSRLPGGGLPATPTFRYDNEYNSNGNLKKMSLYYRNAVTGQLEKVNDYQFDQYDSFRNTTALFENNPYLPLETFIPNNPLTEIHYDANGAIEENVTHVYTYDAEGNPLTRKTTTKATGYPDQVENAKFYY